MRNTLIKLGEHRLADLQDRVVTLHCSLLDTKDDLSRKISRLGTVGLDGREPVNQIVLPLVNRTLIGIARGLERINDRARA